MPQTELLIGGTIKWIDVTNPSNEEVAELSKTYNLNHLTVQDSLQPEHLPKYEFADDVHFMILRYFASNECIAATIQEVTNKVAIFYNEKLLISIHKYQTPFLEVIRNKYQFQHQHTTATGVISRIVWNALETFDERANTLSEKVDVYENEIMQRKTSNNQMEALYRIKREASLSYKVLMLMQEPINHIIPEPGEEPVVQDVKDQHLKMRTLYGQMLEDINNLVNLFMSFSSQRTNEVVKVLTIFSVFFMPLTFIAGIYGMNFDFMPELNQKWGYPAVLILMVIVTITIYIWFKRKNCYKKILMLYRWYQNISFEQPYALSLLLILPILMFWYFGNNKKRQGSMLITTTHFINQVSSGKTILQSFPFILRCLALVCIIIALARPQVKNTETNTEGEGIDIMLCFDISGSMMAKDFQPNRLEAAKELAKQFVLSRTGDNIGIVIFSRVSFTLCPLTAFHDAVISQMENIRSGYLEEEGTAIGSGLATSVDRLKDSKSKSKIIILLTDGVDYGGLIPPDIAKEMAKLYNIKIYSIGVGSAIELEEVVETDIGPRKQRQKLEFNENLLQELAKETGGRYFNAKNKEELQTVYSSIDKLEKSKIRKINYERTEEKYLIWGIAAVTLLLIEALFRYTVFRKFP